VFPEALVGPMDQQLIPLNQHRQSSVHSSALSLCLLKRLVCCRASTCIRHLGGGAALPVPRCHDSGGRGANATQAHTRFESVLTPSTPEPPGPEDPQLPFLDHRHGFPSPDAPESLVLAAMSTGRH
jgi:hypothetical protein